MKPEDFIFSQYSKNSSLRDHLEAIQRHSEAASRISGNQFLRIDKTEFQPDIKVKPGKPYTTGRASSRFVVDAEGNTVINDSPPKVDPKIWNVEVPKSSSNYSPEFYSPNARTKDYLGLDGHLTEIRKHAQSALNMLGSSPSVSEVFKPTRPYSPSGKSPDTPPNNPPNDWSWLFWLIIIGVLLFTLLGHENSEQQPQQNQGLLRDTSVLVEFSD